MSVVLVRRSFLAGLGLAVTGLALGVGIDRDALAAAPPPPPRVALGGAPGLHAGVFVHIAPDGLVSIVCARSEMGQGVRSTLPVVIADEIGADMARVRVLQADGDPAYGDQNTDGSSSVRNGLDHLRKAGATARTMLIAAAAKRWGVKPGACTAHDHAVFHDASKQSLKFGELAAEAAELPVPADKDVKLRPMAELRHVGTELPLLDAPGIVKGTAVFGADVTVAGMLIAVMARPPVVGAKMKRFDPKRALAIPGVKRVVEIAAPAAPYGFKSLGGLAVVATNTWAAMRGRAALEIEWATSDNASYDSTAFREVLHAEVNKSGKVVRHIGDVEAALAVAATKVEAEYHVPHLAHAPMEPPAALARVDATTCEVWASTQNPQAAKAELVKVLGLDAKNVTVHVTLVGGGFGRKSKPDYVVEAALVSRAVGAPVRMQWTREDDIQHDYLHTVSAQRMSAGLDAGGKVTAWRHRTAFPSIGSLFAPNVTHADEGQLQQGVLDFPLAVANVAAENGEAVAHARIGWMRSVCNIHHAFAIGSFIDEIAAAKKADPRDTLLEIVGPPRIVGLTELGVDKLSNYGAPLDKHPIDAGRLRRVIERVTDLSRWSDQRKAGRALGLAAHRSFLSYVAVVAAVNLDAAGKVHVDEAWIVLDAGRILNRERVRSQLEGAVLFGISIALHGAITLRNGAVEQSNFRDYQVARIADAPREIHVEIIASDGLSGGVGEPGVPPVAPAIANAVFALTGKRIRDLPLDRAGLA
ncbi:MAG: molybdopterin cofactor-binding domain-containing protein [Byssovorax sp.]